MARGTTVRMWRRSLIVLIFLVVAGFGLIIARLARLQIVDGEFLQQEAVNQQLADATINAQRGTIYDCNMKELAKSATVWQVVLAPAYLKSDETRELIAEGLSEILDVDEETILEKAQRNSYWEIVQRKVESDVKDQVVAFKNEHGIGNAIQLHEDYKRYYPYEDFAAAVLGFTGTDSQGLAGLEAYYDKYLTGTPGRLVTARNAVGTDMPFEYEQMIPAENGYSLVLSIDEVVQHFVEKNLEEGIVNNKVANRALAIMMNVNTGEIISMAVKEDYNPNSPFTIVDPLEAAKVEALEGDEKAKARSEALEKQWRNKAVSDTYDPGSVFKIITAAIGLEEGVVSEESTFNCPGYIVAYPGTSPIHCHKRTGHGHQTFVEALCNSCNPAFVTIGQSIGAHDFYRYFQAFGLTERTGIDLPGEGAGISHSEDDLGPIQLAVSSFGQTFTVTPIQMITAVAAVANGGHLVQPHLVNRIIDDDGNIIKATDTIVKRQVLSEETCERLNAILELNVSGGSGENAYVSGYRVAGKTGTSEKTVQNLQTGEKSYIASFCGFAPADDPQYALLLFFDEPNGDSIYGSMVAAPVFGSIMEDVLPYLGIEHQYTEEELAKLDTTAPDVEGKTLSEAKNIISQSELDYQLYGEGETVVSQIPAAGQSIPKEGTVVLFLDEQSAQRTVTVPNFVGLSLAEANRVAAEYGLNISISGAGLTSSNAVSYAQSIEEGDEVSPGTVIKVEFAQPDQVE